MLHGESKLPYRKYSIFFSVFYTTPRKRDREDIKVRLRYTKITRSSDEVKRFRNCDSNADLRGKTSQRKKKRKFVYWIF